MLLLYTVSVLHSYTLGTSNRKFAVIVLPGITIRRRSLARQHVDSDFETKCDVGVSAVFPGQQGTTSFPATQQRWLVQRLDNPILKWPSRSVWNSFRNDIPCHVQCSSDVLLNVKGLVAVQVILVGALDCLNLHGIFQVSLQTYGRNANHQRGWMTTALAGWCDRAHCHILSMLRCTIYGMAPGQIRRIAGRKDARRFPCGRCERAWES